MQPKNKKNTNDYGTTWTSNTLSTSDDNYSITSIGNHVFIGGVDHISELTTVNCDQRFFYDDLGRIKASQDAKQASYVTTAYSYTMYDGLGRITEAGQLESTTDPTRAELNPLISDPDQWPESWVGTSINYQQVTHTKYDENLKAAIDAYFTNGQENLRNRVASTVYYDELDHSPSTDYEDYEYGSHYSYDEHGFVKELIQENVALNAIGQDLKSMQYEYDLISGNVNQVVYQKDAGDQFYNRFFYDSDNRVTTVESSRDSLIWDRDMKYYYYLHGPMARTETGDKKIQGTDYAYTLHGWIRSVNASEFDHTKDMGKDGYPDATTPLDEYSVINQKIHNHIARDAFGYSLGYYDGDYAAITSYGNDHLSDVASVNSASPGTELFNGNIRHMARAIKKNDQTKLDNIVSLYRYDQLQRIRQADSWMSSTTYLLANTNSNSYQELYTYDANGNILTLVRNGLNSVQLTMDNLTYNYQTGNNRLDYVNDAIVASTYTDDVESGQTTLNYEYDPNGNLELDVQEGITAIAWNARGKVQQVTKSSGMVIQFEYDAMGQRIVKRVKNSTSQDTWATTYYVRDASGNIMSTYLLDYENPSTNNYVEHFTLTEQDMYGSSRIGVSTHSFDLYRKTFTCSTFVSGGFFGTQTNVNVITIPESDYLQNKRTVGKKQYEQTNHLGNVSTTVTDRRIAVEYLTSGNTDYYEADVVSAADYYAFGMMMPGRTFTSSNYRYGYNKGSEKDDEIKGAGNSYTTEFRQLDIRLGRWLSIDPKASAQPHHSPYCSMGNNPILMNDPKGDILPLIPVIIGICVGAGTEYGVEVYQNYQDPNVKNKWGDVNGWKIGAGGLFGGLTGGFSASTRGVAFIATTETAVSVSSSVTDQALTNVEEGKPWYDISASQVVGDVAFDKFFGDVFKGSKKADVSALEKKLDRANRLVTENSKAPRKEAAKALAKEITSTKRKNVWGEVLTTAKKEGANKAVKEAVKGNGDGNTWEKYLKDISKPKKNGGG